MIWLRSLLVIAIYLAVSSISHAQNQQQKGPPPRQAPMVRPQPVRPPPQIRPQQTMQKPVAPRQMAPGQIQGRPGQMQARPGQFQQPGHLQTRPAGQTLVRPGVIRGPAGALRQVRPPHVAFNPSHRVGRAGLRYNRQAFMFRRGHGVFRRGYYRGPNGDIFFYDEEVPPDDAAVANIANVDELPQCPEDSDDCQGFSESGVAAVSNVAAMPSQAIARAQALSFLQSIQRELECSFQEDGATHEEHEGVIAPYETMYFEIIKDNAGNDKLWLRGDWDPPMAHRLCRLLTASYPRDKPKYDAIFRAFRALGARTP
jgi:hypothetical protein